MLAEDYDAAVQHQYQLMQVAAHSLCIAFIGTNSSPTRNTSEIYIKPLRSHVYAIICHTFH